jgi:hypothetical protein
LDPIERGQNLTGEQYNIAMNVLSNKLLKNSVFVGRESKVIWKRLISTFNFRYLSKLLNSKHVLECSVIVNGLGKHLKPAIWMQLAFGPAFSTTPFLRRFSKCFKWFQSRVQPLNAIGQFAVQSTQKSAIGKLF